MPSWGAGAGAGSGSSDRPAWVDRMCLGMSNTATTKAMATIMQAFDIHDAVHARMTATLQPLGLATNEAATLSILRSTGPPSRLTPTLLSKTIHYTTGGMTRLLDSVQGRALVRMIPSPQDRRSLLVELTEEGIEMSNRVLELQAKVTGEVLAGLTASESSRLEKLLGKLGLGP